MEEINGKVIVIPYYPGHSSTKIKKALALISKDKKNEPPRRKQRGIQSNIRPKGRGI
jgi:hypothetical protein